MTSKLNPWRHGALEESIARLEKTGIKRPAAFDLIEEILDSLDAIEREDARREECRKASEQFRQRQRNQTEN